MNNDQPNFAKVMGRVVDNRANSSDFKNIKAIVFEAEILINQNTKYNINLALVPGPFPTVRVLNDKSTDSDKFKNQFPYTYDLPGRTWVPTGFSIDVAYKELENLTPKEAELYNFKTAVLNLLHRTAIDSFTNYFLNHNLGIFIISPLNNNICDVFYTGHIQHNIQIKSAIIEGLCDSSCNASEHESILDFYCDVKLARVNGSQSQDIINKLINALNASNRGPIQLPNNIEIFKYSSIERKLSAHK